MAFGPQPKTTVTMDVIIRAVMSLRGNTECNLCPAWQEFRNKAGVNFTDVVMGKLVQQ